VIGPLSGTYDCSVRRNVDCEILIGQFDLHLTQDPSHRNTVTIGVAYFSALGLSFPVARNSPETPP